MPNAGPVHGAMAKAAPPEAPLLKLEDFLPQRINVLSSLVSQALTRVYGRYGIGIPEWRGFVTPRGNGAVAGKGGGAPPPIGKNKGPPPGGQPQRHRIFYRPGTPAALRGTLLLPSPPAR